MKLLQLIIILLLISLSFTIQAQQMESDTSKVLVRFNEPVSRDGIFDLRNYTIIKDDSTNVKIFKVGVSNDNRFIVLFTEKQDPNSSYKIIINNIKDKSGHLISESNKMAVY